MDKPEDTLLVMADAFQKVSFLWGQEKSFKIDNYCQERLENLNMLEISSMTKNDASCSG